MGIAIKKQIISRSDANTTPLTCDQRGNLYFCRGRNNGCTDSRTVWGSNPYTNDSSMCRAALHGNFIDTNGGCFYIKAIGSLTQYTGTTNNGITTTNYGAWEGVRMVEAPNLRLNQGCGRVTTLT
jgi:hypothetical protein